MNNKKCRTCIHYKKQICNNFNIIIDSSSNNLAEECKRYRIKNKFKNYKNRNIVRR